MLDKTKSKGFTLAETIIVLAVLGIIAVIVVPPVIRKNKEAATRLKLKRCMSAYENLVTRIVLENGIKTDSDFKSWADSEEKNQCANTSNYFKIKKGSGCMFKTYDDVNWYIDDILNPVISVEPYESVQEARQKANEEDNKTAFFMLTMYDENLDTYRTNDLAYTLENGTEDQKKELQRVYDFLKKK